MGFPGSSNGKESACEAGALGSVPGSGGSPGERNDYPLQQSCQGNSMEESDTTEWLPLSLSMCHYIRGDILDTQQQVWQGTDQSKQVSLSRGTLTKIQIPTLQWQDCESFQRIQQGKLQRWGCVGTWGLLNYAIRSRFSRVRLCATPQTAAHQAPPSLGFSRQEHWSGLPFPSPFLNYGNNQPTKEIWGILMSVEYWSFQKQRPLLFLWGLGLAQKLLEGVENNSSNIGTNVQDLRIMSLKGTAYMNVSLNL